MTATWQHEPEARRPLLRALRRRRELRAGLVQAVYTTVGLLLGLTLPGVDGGPTVEASAVTPLMLAVAGGFLPFIALVFSLLFLVVQYGNTTVSPRLTLFRDDPFLWHAFAFFVAVFVYASTAGVRLGNAAGHVTVAVPILAIALVFTALLLARALQLRALGLLQFPATMEQIRRRGEAVINALYATPTSTGPTVDPSDELPAVATPLR